MDYEAIDKDMSSYVVSCLKNTTRFYLTPEGLATDIQGRAQRWRWQDQADNAATQAWQEWQHGFDWQPLSVAEMMAL